MSPEQRAHAADLRQHGFSWEIIALKIGGISMYRLRCTMEPAYKKRRKEQSVEAFVRRREHRVKLAPEAISRTSRGNGPGDEVGHKAAGLHQPHASQKPSPAMLADRDSRMALPTPRFGDPIPGRSALDQKLARA